MTLDPPVFVTVSDRELLFPTVMLPKLRLLGLGLKLPGETPVPDSEIVSVGFDAFEVTVTLPLALVAEVGVNVTPMVAACPGASVRVEMPSPLNPLPVITA